MTERNVLDLTTGTVEVEALTPEEQQAYDAAAAATAAADAVDVIRSGNRQTILNNLAQDMVVLQAELDDTNANINSNPAARIKEQARVLRRLVRVITNALEATE